MALQPRFSPPSGCKYASWHSENVSMICPPCSWYVDGEWSLKAGLAAAEDVTAGLARETSLLILFIPPTSP
jgi:hypothetical protein